MQSYEGEKGTVLHALHWLRTTIVHVARLQHVSHFRVIPGYTHIYLIVHLGTSATGAARPLSSPLLREKLTEPCIRITRGAKCLRTSLTTSERVTSGSQFSFS